MSYLIKNRDLILSIRELNEDTHEYENEIDRAVFLAKTINYDFKAKGSEFFGIKKADTLQWWSSEIQFDITADSYISPFSIPTPINSDESIRNLYNLFTSKFYETNFELYKYKFFLEIKNCPIGPTIFKGIVDNFKCNEGDDALGLVKYNISFTGKSERQDKVQQGADAYASDLSMNSKR